MSDDAGLHEALERLSDLHDAALEGLDDIAQLDDETLAEFLAWDQETKALCALTQLSQEQLAGLERLAEMSDDEVESFGVRVEAAWEANSRAVRDAKEAVSAAIAEVARVELACYDAARHRNPQRPKLTDAEADSIRAAVAVVEDARQAREEAMSRFKAGVTAEQLAGG